jgi:hypothetical protein
LPVRFSRNAIAVNSPSRWGRDARRRAALDEILVAAAGLDEVGDV